MTYQKRCNRVGLFLAFIYVVFLFTPAQAQQYRLRFSSFEPPTGALTVQVMVPWAEEVSKASNGVLQIDMYAGGSLGRNPVQQLKLVQDGVADIAWIVPGYTPGRFDDVDVVGLPFLIQNSTEASVALWRMYARGELAGFDDLKVLAFAVTPPVKIHAMSVIKSVEDMRGKRVRAPGSILAKVVERLGGVPVTLGGGQVAEALSRGVVDATLANWGFVGDFKIDEVASQHLIVPLGGAAVMIAMQRARYEALPTSIKTLIDNASGENLSRKLARVFELVETEYADRARRSKRNHLLTPPEEEVANWKVVLAPVSQEWRSASPVHEKLYQSLAAELNAYRNGTR